MRMAEAGDASDTSLYGSSRSTMYGAGREEEMELPS